MSLSAPSAVTSNHLIRTPAYPWLLDDAAFVRAGHVLKLIDIAGSETALRHQRQGGVKGLVVTASMDRTNFHEPIRLWEMICLESAITRVWRTSMECEVRVRAESILTGEGRDIAVAYLIFVALDARTREKIVFPPYQPTTPDEITRAEAADRRKRNRLQEGRVAPMIAIEADDHPVVLTRRMTLHDANAQSNVFGGIILSMIDEAGSMAARRQTLEQPIVGVRQDRMSFLSPAFIGETIEARAVVTRTWHTSMEVQVEICALNPNLSEPRNVASSYLVYVRLGPDGRPGEAPPWTPRTETQKQRAERAEIRRRNRLAEEAEEQAFP